MPAMLDHILLGCRDLEAGIAFVERNTGVRAAFGGVHPGRGTRNALLSLGEKHYLEVIARDPEQPDAADSFGLAKLNEPRLITWAAHPGDLDRFATRLRSAHLAFDGPTPGSRQRPDGRVLEWKTLNLRDNQAGLLPFFIEWGARTTHPSVDAPAGCQLTHFEAAAPNDAEIVHCFALLGLAVPVAQRSTPQLLARISGPAGVMTVAS